MGWSVLAGPLVLCLLPLTPEGQAPCPANSVGADVLTGCTCIPGFVGTVSPTDSSPFYSGSCEACQPGRFQPDDDQTSCIQCRACDAATQYNLSECNITSDRRCGCLDHTHVITNDHACLDPCDGVTSRASCTPALLVAAMETLVTKLDSAAHAPISALISPHADPDVDMRTICTCRKLLQKIRRRGGSIPITQACSSHDNHVCASSPCQNGGTCVDGSDDPTQALIVHSSSIARGQKTPPPANRGDFVCFCRVGFGGRTCGHNIDECVSQPCLNDGVCVDMMDGYQCACTDAWQGQHCELERMSCECADQDALATAMAAERHGRTVAGCADLVDACNNITDAAQMATICPLTCGQCTVPHCHNGTECVRHGPGQFECVCPRGTFRSFHGECVTCFPGYDGDQCEKCGLGHRRSPQGLSSYARLGLLNDHLSRVLPTTVDVVENGDMSCDDNFESGSSNSFSQSWFEDEDVSIPTAPQLLVPSCAWSPMTSAQMFRSDDGILVSTDVSTTDQPRYSVSNCSSFGGGGCLHLSSACSRNSLSGAEQEVHLDVGSWYQLTFEARSPLVPGVWAAETLPGQPEDTNVALYRPTFASSWYLDYVPGKAVDSDTTSSDSRWVTYPETSVPRDLVAYWPLDGHLRDIVGSNDAVIRGDGVHFTGNDGGVANSALRFSGHGYVNLGPARDLNLTGQYTWSVWIKRGDGSIGSQRTVISCWREQQWLRIFKSADDVQYLDVNGFSERGNNVGTVSEVDTEWHNLVSVKRAGSYGSRFYIDGNLVDSRFLDTLPSEIEGDVYLGADLSQFGTEWIGDLDEVALWRRALSDDEVKTVYEMGHSKMNLAEEPSLVVDLQQRHSIGSVHIFAGLPGTGNDYGLCSHTVAVWTGPETDISLVANSTVGWQVVATGRACRSADVKHTLGPRQVARFVRLKTRSCDEFKGVRILELEVYGTVEPKADFRESLSLAVDSLSTEIEISHQWHTYDFTFKATTATTPLMFFMIPSASRDCEDGGMTTVQIDSVKLLTVNEPGGPCLRQFCLDGEAPRTELERPSTYSRVCWHSCAEAVVSNGTATSGVYRICEESDTAAYDVFCDMDTNGGGWTLVMNVAPTDGNSAGYNNQDFWTASAEYGSFEHRFSTDYKSPAAYSINADELMIQSAELGENGQILGWRRWPMLSARTFGSLFRRGFPPSHRWDPCETGQPDAWDLGRTNEWDDIIRQGGCLHTDVNPGNNLIRMTSYDLTTNGTMGGIASCLHCHPSNDQFQPHPLGTDRALCDRGNYGLRGTYGPHASGCYHDQIMQMTRDADCRGVHCYGSYGQTINSAWNIRIFVRTRSWSRPLSTLTNDNVWLDFADLTALDSIATPQPDWLLNFTLFENVARGKSVEAGERYQRQQGCIRSCAALRAQDTTAATGVYTLCHVSPGSQQESGLAASFAHFRLDVAINGGHPHSWCLEHLTFYQNETQLTTLPIHASAQSALSDSPPESAFSPATDTEYCSNGYVGTGWLQYSFDVPTSIDSYSMKFSENRGQQYRPTAWTLRGRTADGIWKILDWQTYPSRWEHGEVKSFPITHISSTTYAEADAKHEVYCDMDTNGGGWTLVMNVAPTDGNSVGYNNQDFWTASAEYGSFEHRFSTDYKSPAAYSINADELMIQSAELGENGQILGWRRWPMLTARTFSSLFVPVVNAHDPDPCETGQPDAWDLGRTNEWDDIIRQGGCLHTDVYPNAANGADLIRMTTYDVRGDNRMSGIAACRDCAGNVQSNSPNHALLGTDRAACSASYTTSPSGCHASEFAQLSNNPDCRGDTCPADGGHLDAEWNIRIYIREAARKHSDFFTDGELTTRPPSLVTDLTLADEGYPFIFTHVPAIATAYDGGIFVAEANGETGQLQIDSNEEECQFATANFLPGEHSWVVPDGVHNVTARVWGGGGAGGLNSYGWGMGGGGGGFSHSVVAVTPGTTIRIVVGSGGLAPDSCHLDQRGDNGGASFIEISNGILVEAGGGFGGGSNPSVSGIEDSRGGAGITGPGEDGGLYSHDRGQYGGGGGGGGARASSAAFGAPGSSHGLPFGGGGAGGSGCAGDFPTAVRTFTGADLGEGLDFTGNFLYAVDIGGPGGQVIGDANFTDDTSTLGVSVTAQYDMLEWGSALDFGDSAADNALASVMHSIRWSAHPSPVIVTLEVTPGTKYRLQLMFHEQCCSRAFDVLIDGVAIVDEYSPQRDQGGMSEPGRPGAAIKYDFVATASTVTVSLEGADAFADANPILNALTLEIEAGTHPKPNPEFYVRAGGGAPGAVELSWESVRSRSYPAGLHKPVCGVWAAGHTPAIDDQHGLHEIRIDPCSGYVKYSEATLPSDQYEAIGYGFCSSVDGRAPYCEPTLDLSGGDEMCRESCDSSEECTGYLQKDGRCFLFHNGQAPLGNIETSFGAASWDGCYAQEHSGVIDSVEGIGHGICYRKQRAPCRAYSTDGSDALSDCAQACTAHEGCVGFNLLQGACQLCTSADVQRTPGVAQSAYLKSKQLNLCPAEEERSMSSAMAATIDLVDPHVVAAAHVINSQDKSTAVRLLDIEASNDNMRWIEMVQGARLTPNFRGGNAGTTVRFLSADVGERQTPYRYWRISMRSPWVYGATRWALAEVLLLAGRDSDCIADLTCPDCSVCSLATCDGCLDRSECTRFPSCSWANGLGCVSRAHTNSSCSN